MSADNGYIIRKSDNDKFILQMYFASNDASTSTVGIFDTLDEALEYYTTNNFPSEYGLKIYKSCYPEEETKMETKKFLRKPFTIDALQLTEDNFADVAKWCEGVVVEDSVGIKHIKVQVQNPLTARQTKAFVGDWVLSSKRGFKVYTDRAFKQNFVPDGKAVVEVPLEEVVSTIHEIGFV